MAVSLSRHTGIVALLYWIWDGVDRTIFTGAGGGAFFCCANAYL